MVEAGEERDAAAALAEQRAQQLDSLAGSQARLAAQVRTVALHGTWERTPSRQSYQHWAVGHACAHVAMAG